MLVIYIFLRLHSFFHLSTNIFEIIYSIPAVDKYWEYNDGEKKNNIGLSFWEHTV